MTKRENFDARSENWSGLEKSSLTIFQDLAYIYIVKQYHSTDAFPKKNSDLTFQAARDSVCSSNNRHDTANYIYLDAIVHRPSI